MITRDSIETAYSFFHQKLRIYEHSTLQWQREDIEYAIASYAEGMNRELYARLASGSDGFLLTHSSFAADLTHAVSLLEAML